MKKIALSGESTMDFQRDNLEKYDVYSIPFHVQMGESTYLDGEKTNEEIFEFVRESGLAARTSAANIQELEDHFERILGERDEILHLTISSELSSGYQNAQIAKGERDNIEVIDSRSISLGIAMMAIKARKLIDEGKKTLKEIAEEIRAYRSHVDASLMIEDLSFMAKGGRCPRLVALGANFFKIRPVVSMKEGKISLSKMIRGKIKDKVTDYIDSRLNGKNDVDYSFCALGYTSKTRIGVEEAVNHLKAKGFKEVLVTVTNATDACHGGPNVIGFAFAYGK